MDPTVILLQARSAELGQAAEAELDGAASPSGGASFREGFSADGAAKAAEPYFWDYQTATLTYNLVSSPLFPCI